MYKRKVCVVTGTRAEYGLLYRLMQELQNAADFELQIIATGMHLSPEFGLTYQIIEQDGFLINEKIAMLLSSDTPVGIAKSMGLGTIGFADALDRLRPDLLVVLGDRYEILAAAQAALVAKIPIAHIAGGDTTEGAFDESIRHSLTKMAHLHFVTNEAAARRVRQMGENPEHIFKVGSPGIDQIKRLTLLTRSELEKALDFRFRQHNLLITYHPVTLAAEPATEQFKQVLLALESISEQSDVGLIFTYPNSDPEGRGLISMIDDFVSGQPKAKAFTSLGQLRYLSTIAQVEAVVGNSSSGLYEAPSFGKATVNIGNRQKGRLQATSVINCAPNAEEIEKAIKKAFVRDFGDVVNPYGDGRAGERIMAILRQTEWKPLLQKHFFEVEFNDDTR